MENKIDYKEEHIYLMARSRHEGYLIQVHDNGTDIVRVQPRELIIEHKKMGEFRSLIVSARGLAEPGTFGEILPGNLVYEVQFKEDYSYRLIPASFSSANMYDDTLPILMNGKFTAFDMGTAEFILREKVGNEYFTIHDAVDLVYKDVVSNPSVDTVKGQSPEETVVKRVLAKAVAVA